jgi:hypothetical protein
MTPLRYVVDGDEGWKEKRGLTIKLMRHSTMNRKRIRLFITTLLAQKYSFMKKINTFESGLLISLAALLVLSSCTPQTPDSNPIKPVTSPIPAPVFHTATVNATVAPSPIPKTPTPGAPTPEPPKISDRVPVTDASQIEYSKISESNSFSVSVSKGFLDEANLESFSLNPEKQNMTIQYKDETSETISKTEATGRLWIARLAFILTNSTLEPPPVVTGPLKIFHDADQSSIQSMLQARKDNKDAGENGFNGYFNFGQGKKYDSTGKPTFADIKGQINGFEVKVVNSTDEWVAIQDWAKKEGVLFKLSFTPSTGSAQSLIYLDKQGILETVACLPEFMG